MIVTDQKAIFLCPAIALTLLLCVQVTSDHNFLSLHKRRFF